VRLLLVAIAVATLADLALATHFAFSDNPILPAYPAYLFCTGAGAPPPARTDADASPRRCFAAAKRGRRRSRPADPVPAHPALPAYPAYPAYHAYPAYPALPAQPAAQSKSSKPKLFAPLDLGLLEGPDREQWQKPDQIMDALLIAEGSIVAEIGAAGAWFTVRLAQRVGQNGKVYAEDIQPEMIEAINRRAQRENLTNVKPILGAARDPRLPNGLDAVLIVEVYREMDDPVELLKKVARSLKPQGRIGIVDFTAGGGGPGPAPEERVSPETEIRAAEAAGLQLIKREDVPPFMFLLVFGRRG
jgi:SAM-dependent methyltransferase